MTFRRLTLLAALLAAGCSGESPGTTGSPGSGSGSSGSSSSSSSGSSGSSSSGSSGSSASSGSGSGSGSTGASSSSSSSSGSGSSGSSGQQQGAPSVSAVTVELAGAPEIRQGGTAVLHISGANLLGASAVRLGTFTVQITTDAEDEIVGGVTVPHGTAPGALDLAVTTPGGSTSFSAAVQVTPIVISTTGDDAAGGVPSAPFATVSHGLSVAATSDTVLLMPGTYASAAEAFPVGATPSDLTCNVGNGVAFAGVNDAGANPLILDASDAGGSPLVLCGGAQVSNVDVQGFGYGLVVLTGSAQLSNVHLTGAANDGLYISGANALANVASGVGAAGNSAFDSNGHDGVQVLNHGNFFGAGFSASHNDQDGIESVGATDISVRFAHLDDNARNGLFVSGATLLNAGPSMGAAGNGAAGMALQGVTRTSSLGGVSLEDNLGDGLSASGTTNNLNVSDSFIAGNGGAGFGIDAQPDAGALITVVNSSLLGNDRGLRVRGKPSQVVLNAVVAGSNTVKGNRVNLDVDVRSGSLVSLRGVLFDATDGGAFPDANAFGGENVPWTYNAVEYINANGQTQAPLVWDPDAGEGPFNYLLFDGGGGIQF